MMSATIDFAPTQPPEEWVSARGQARGLLADSPLYAGFLLLAVVSHHWLLCFLQTRGLGVSVAMVAMAELLIYAACLPLLLRRLSLRSLVVVFVALGLSGLIALARGGHFDPKAARDLLIPLVFVWVGRSYAQGSRSVDGPLLAITAVIIAIGLVEAVLPDLYSRFFNTFNYYVNLGGINASSAQVVGQSVTLNGMRPEGIGRTVLPQLLGASRVSSVFLEPVSLGNFAVILTAYGLAKPWREWRRTVWFLAAAVVLITFADSRFGLYVFGLLLLLRVTMHGGMHVLAVVFPVIGACSLLALATYAPSTGDNLLGRMTVSGQYLLGFDEMNLLGLRGYATAFGDMGYAYVISRFGLPGIVLMWLCIFMLPLHDEAARRFRTSMSAYVTLILCVSGTSLFALKTAGVLWFLFGAMSMLKPKEETT
jgi:putative polymerase